MLYRVPFIAFLSLTLILGPRLCCCSTGSIAVNYRGTQKCCERGVLAHTGFPNVRPTVGEGQVPANNGPLDGRGCPCGKHNARIIAIAGGSLILKVFEMRALIGPELASLPVAVDLADYNALMIARNNPIGLHGGEVLRAYQIMRC